MNNPPPGYQTKLDGTYIIVESEGERIKMRRYGDVKKPKWIEMSKRELVDRLLHPCVSVRIENVYEEDYGKICQYMYVRHGMAIHEPIGGCVTM